MEHANIARVLERMGDHATRLAHLVNEHSDVVKIKTKDMPLSAVPLWSNHLKTIVHNMYTRDVELIHSAKLALAQLGNDVEEAESELWTGRGSAERLLSEFRISESVRRLCAYSVNFAEILLNMLMYQRLEKGLIGDRMSFLDRISKDKAGTILFLTSLSVILITLGIIQTLLFETITFFTDIAEHRGWFSLDWDVGGIFSASGFACLLLVVTSLLDHESKKGKNRLSIIPQEVWNPHHGIVKAVFILVILQLLFNDSFLLGLSILFFAMVWRATGILQMKRIFGGNIEISNTWRNVLSLFIFITLFDAITMNYSGALGEFFLQSQWTPTGACEDRRSLCDTMSFGVNSLLLTTLQVAFGALIIAVPLGVGCAIYLSEYAPPRLVAIVKPTLEILAGIPSVVYGFFAFIYIGPLVVEFGEYAFANGWIDEPQMFSIQSTGPLWSA